MRSAGFTLVHGLRGSFRPSGDKSIAHRLLMLGALATGTTHISNFPYNKDCLATLSVLRRLGVRIRTQGDAVTVQGKGLYGLRAPSSALFVRESGTTLRLMLGILAGMPFPVTLLAGPALSRRPMRRVAVPLRLMGAHIKSKVKRQKSKGKTEEFPPLRIEGGCLRPIVYRMPVASAQVKSAVLLAGLYCKGKTTVIEPAGTRDHTERLLRLFGARVKSERKKSGAAAVTVFGTERLASVPKVSVPGDVSSASFFIVLAALLPHSRLVVRGVSLNPSRSGFLDVLRRMGAKIEIRRSGPNKGEPSGDLIVVSSRLRGVSVSSRETPGIIDELPVLMVAACFARGRSVFRGVGELRVKETDRLRSMVTNLSRMGGHIRVRKRPGQEDIVIDGPSRLKGSRLSSFADHRTAMSTIVAALNAEGRTTLDDVSCIDKSFPEFLNILKSLVHK